MNATTILTRTSDDAPLDPRIGLSESLPPGWQWLPEDTATMTALREFSSHLAHDINNYLAAVCGLFQLVMEDFPHHRSSQEASLIIEDTFREFQAFSRGLQVFAGRQLLTPQPVMLSTIIEEETRRYLEQPPPHARIECALDLHMPALLADLEQLRFVIASLIGYLAAPIANDRQVWITSAVVQEEIPASPTPPLTAAEVATSPGTTAAGGKALLVVRGNSPQPDLTNARAAFAPRRFSPRKESRGWEMSMVYGIVHQMGGTIALANGGERGLLARVCWPLPATKPKAADVPSAGKWDAVAESSARILVVDDEDSVRKFVVHTLRNKGFTVESASGGIDALQRFSACQGNFDLVVSDICMPDLDGRDLVAALTMRNPSLRVILSSGLIPTGEVPLLGQPPQRHFLPKPFAARDLLRLVRAILGQDESSSA